MPSTIYIPPNITTLSAAVFIGDPGDVKSIKFCPGCQVTAIAAKTFKSFKSLKSICIPASVEELGDDCFGELISLNEVTFEARSKLRIIESQVFRSCGTASGQLLRAVDRFCYDLMMYEVGEAPEYEFVDDFHFFVSNKFVSRKTQKPV
jgi:hypothetical protein